MTRRFRVAHSVSDVRGGSVKLKLFFLLCTSLSVISRRLVTMKQHFLAPFPRTLSACPDKFIVNDSLVSKKINAEKRIVNPPRLVVSPSSKTGLAMANHLRNFSDCII